MNEVEADNTEDADEKPGRLIEVVAPVERGRLARFNGPILFLGGGITGCPDWQTEAMNYLYRSKVTGTVLNPRRPEQMPTDKRWADQIPWEDEGLTAADTTSFWFPAESVCPITLFELGEKIADESTVDSTIVGFHPQYPKLDDVLDQLKTKGFPEGNICLGFGVFMDRVVEELKSIRKEWYWKEKPEQRTEVIA